MKRVLGILIMIGLLTAVLSPLTIAKPVADENNATPVFLDIYTSPRHPLGANWATGLGGDNITVFANVTNALNNDIWVTWAFCNRVQCLPDSYDVMTHLGGTLYKFVLPGDAYNGWSYFEASSAPGQHIYIRLEADPTDGVGSSVAYPGLGEWHNIYPAWPPQQINATATLSKTTMWTNENFWVNGTSNYWNSTSYPNDFSKLLPADECPVSVKVGPNTFPGKTNIWGNYSVLVSAPAVAGQHILNVTVSNSTANRNVPCKAVNQTITVNAYPFVDKVSIAITDHSVYPGDLVTVSGNAKYNTAAAVQTNMAYVNYTGMSHTVSTNAAGDYSKQFNAPMTPGNYTVTTTVVDQLYLGTKKSNSTYLVVETPTIDVTISPNSTTPYPSTKLTVQGTATYGNGLPVISGAVNVSVVGQPTLYNDTITTNALGNYLAEITVPATVGPYTIDASVTGAGYGGVTGDAQEDIVVLLVPTPDLRASNTDMRFNETAGHYLEGHAVKITLNVSNTGNAPASNVLVNFTSWTNVTNYIGSDNITLLSVSGVSVVEFDWIAVAGNHTINATVDPLNTIDEALEANNKASKVLFIDGDADLDNVGNTVDGDDDNDGYNDTVEITESTDALDNSSAPADIDNDYIPDSTDPDRDGDGFNNTADVFPSDPLEWSDLDDDGTGDNSDPDIDGDGIGNLDDEYPLDHTEWYDTDGDGTGNNADDDDDNDTFLDIWEEFLGTDSLDILDIPEDTDGDGAPDGNPANSESWMDTDDDGDDVADSIDAFPQDDSETADFDGDGIGDNSDTDNDSDGISDSEDVNLWDTDNDGLENSMDLDDDGDGIPDTTDSKPFDTDNDGQTNDADSDDDGDGVPDSTDAFPMDSEEYVDTDLDGIGDNADTDDDGNGIPDVEELETESEDGGGNSWIYITAAIIIVVVVAVLVMLMKGGKLGAKADAPPENTVSAKEK